MRTENRRVLPTPDLSDPELLAWVADFYHETLIASSNWESVLAGIGVKNPEAVSVHRVGLSNRTLGQQLLTIDGGRQIRGRLQTLGVFRADTGHEHLNGCLVLPAYDASGAVCQLGGLRIGREGEAPILSLPGRASGVFNLKWLEEGQEWLLFGDPFDALSAWSLGFRRSTAAGPELSEELAKVIAERKPASVALFSGCNVTEDLRFDALSKAISILGVAVVRLQLPSGESFRDFIKAVSEPASALSALIAVSRAGTSKEEGLDANGLGRVTVRGEISVLKNDSTEVVLGIGDRSYRIRGLARNTGYEALRVSIRVTKGEAWHLDTIDLAQAKQRGAFVSAAADETGIGSEILKHDVGRVLLKLEEIHEAFLRAQVAPVDNAPPLSEAERVSAMELLRAPDLLERIGNHAAQCGIAGERTNVMAGYLGAVSRLLDRPLAIVVQSSSAAGKTTLMDAILAFMPPEVRQRYSAVTGQSLFYLGRENLRHKILAIAEQEGAEKATYALKLLQSEGELRLAATGNDEASGRTETQAHVVSGPTMIFLTTTAPLLDDELQNRCIVLTVDESREQTERIHALQREARTEAGLARKVRREEILTLHRNAQRLLEALPVFNPYADKLRFLSDQLRTRRDHEKYLILIDAFAVLFQHQRDRTTIAGRECIVVSLDDIEWANALAHEILGRGLDDTPPQAKRLLGLIQEMQKKNQGTIWRRRDLRAFTGWSDTALKVHLKRLVELEYVLPKRDAKLGYRYELLYDGDLANARPHLSGLIDPKELKSSGVEVQQSGQTGGWSGRTEPRPESGQPLVNSRSAGGPMAVSL